MKSRTAIAVTFLVLALVGRARPAAAQPNYRFAISASNTDPSVDTAVFAPGINFAYLWLVSCDLPEPLEDGMRAAELGIVSSPQILHLATTMQGTFLNAGTVTDLLVATPDCVCGPVLMAELLILVQTTDPGVMCIGPHAGSGGLNGVDCRQLPEVWPGAGFGLGVNGPAPGEGCEVDLSGGCCLPDGSCTLVASASECSALGGSFRGAGSDCVEPCAEGACCLANGSCVTAAGEGACDALGGEYLGDGISCAGEDCIHPVGIGVAWTISGSPVDPLQTNVDLAGGQLEMVYLWLACSSYPDGTSGIQAAEFALVPGPGLLHLATTPLNGFLNAGGGSDLQLAVGACPSGPILAAELLVLSTGDPASMCFAPSSNGTKAIVDCNSELRDFSWTGLAANGADGCSKGPAPTCEGPVGVEAHSWGKVKALYR